MAAETRGAVCCFCTSLWLQSSRQLASSVRTIGGTTSSTARSSAVVTWPQSLSQPTFAAKSAWNRRHVQITGVVGKLRAAVTCFDRPRTLPELNTKVGTGGCPCCPRSAAETFSLSGRTVKKVRGRNDSASESMQLAHKHRLAMQDTSLWPSLIGTMACSQRHLLCSAYDIATQFLNFSSVVTRFAMLCPPCCPPHFARLLSFLL